MTGDVVLAACVGVPALAVFGSFLIMILLSPKRGNLDLPPWVPWKWLSRRKRWAALKQWRRESNRFRSKASERAYYAARERENARLLETRNARIRNERAEDRALLAKAIADELERRQVPYR